MIYFSEISLSPQCPRYYGSDTHVAVRVIGLVLAKHDVTVSGSSTRK